MFPQVRRRSGRTLTLLASAAAIVLTGIAIPNATAGATGEEWSADLSSITNDDVNVRYAGGVLRMRTTTPATSSSVEGAEASGQLITAQHGHVLRTGLFARHRPL
ncbi:MAG: hypothetical protein GEV11_10345 [Streptosporangiales bacterium]|nr:hypothetical protein [Streptosporangiales bacterium]